MRLSPVLPSYLGRVLWVSIWLMAHAHAQERVYKCNNNVYTNNPQDSRVQGCKPIDGGNVTIVQGTKPAPGATPAGKTSSPTTAGSNGALAQPRVDPADQRARDSDARLILESELKKAEARQLELLKEYNNGEPEKLGPETRNQQKYLDRVAEMKAAIARNESDIAGIRRELGRLPAGR